jgi:hypothetical protein
MKSPALGTALLCASCAIACVSSSARADVGWEHTATVRVSTIKEPVAKLKIYNHWTPQRHRLLLKYAVHAMPGCVRPPTGMSTFPTLTPGGVTMMSQPSSRNSGGVALIQRLDDDRIVAYETQTRSYVSEAFRPLLEKLRFDPWKKLAPELSGKPVPELSPEQRMRLGAEIRAASAPFLKRVSRTYFRELPTTHTLKVAENVITTVDCRGYRLTWLINTGGVGNGQEQWTRISYEWWLASDLEGDEVVRQFRAAWLNSMKNVAWPSTSMWINEFRPVLMYALPEAFLRAIETIIPPEPSPRAGFGGPPLRVYVTVVPPPLQRSQMGDVRAEIALTRHEWSPVPDQVFEAPEGYKHVPIDPEKLGPILNGDVFGRYYDDSSRQRTG